MGGQIKDVDWQDKARIGVIGQMTLRPTPTLIIEILAKFLFLLFSLIDQVYPGIWKIYMDIFVPNPKYAQLNNRYIFYS